MSDTQAVLPVQDEPKVINWKPWALRVLFGALGILLGLWLSMPVSSIVEHTYKVHPGDSLERVANQLEIDADEMIALNGETYPLINDGRLQEGWSLVYIEGGETPRWRYIIDEIIGWFKGTRLGRGLENDIARIENEQYMNPLGGRPQNKTAFAQGRYLISLINYLREEKGAGPVSEDEELMLLAQARAAIMCGIYDEPYSNYPLCEGCVELRSSLYGNHTVSPHWDTDWQINFSHILLGEYDYVGASALVPPQKQSYPAAGCTIVIFK